MGCTGNEWVNMLLGKNRDISMVAIFQIRLRSFFFDVGKRRQCSEVTAIL